MRKSIFAAALTTALAVTAFAPANAVGPPDKSAPAAATTSATITGSVGERVTDGSSLRLRYVGDPAPAGYTGNYQLGPRIVTASPEDEPVTMTGTLDLSGMSTKGQVAIIGLYDAQALSNGATSHKQGAGIYVAYGDSYFDIGVSDGDAGGGEFVQAFKRVPKTEFPNGIAEVEFVLNGAQDPATCASDPADVPTADGCMTLTINGEFTVSDSYGSISPEGIETELDEGGHPGWYTAYPAGHGPEIGVHYDLVISPAQLVLTAMEQCKKGGFEAFGFKNQGQCIASLKANSHS